VKLGIVKATGNENRVALTPESVKLLSAISIEILAERNSGIHCYCPDEDFQSAGASIVSHEELFSTADVLVKVNEFTAQEIDTVRTDQIIIGALNPFGNKELVQQLISKGLTSFSLELVPRISRAQGMDILSSMATVAGYKAVLAAAANLPRFLPMFMTAAGTIKPAKVLILGAGVAGLQALATARRLGAVVEVFDVRTAVKEEVISLGGKFIEVQGARENTDSSGYAVDQSWEYKQKQGELIAEHAVKSDIIICTAQIPGKPAPLLITKDTVGNMKSGSVIVDLAASAGGNCDLTKNNEIVEYNKVKIIGNSNYPSEMAGDASEMFGKNIVNFTKLLIDDKGNLNVNLDDEIIAGTCLTHKGQLVHAKVKEVLSL
jgi:NAD(P) transhydrogenase subunit alpha